VRVLFTPMAWNTHYFQMVGTAWAFRAAGHDVRVAAQPPVLDAIRGSGITAVSVGGDYDMVAGVADLARARDELARSANVEGPGRFPPDVLRKLLEMRMIPHIEAAEDMTEDLVAFAHAWRPDLVISDPLVYAAPPAAAVAGAPLVRHLWGPDMTRKIALPGTGPTEPDDPRAEWPRELIDLYARYGAKASDDVAVRTLDTCPASLQLPGVPNRVPLRHTSYNGTAVAPSWVLETGGRPRVCVTWGAISTTLLGPDAFVVPRILEALRGLDVEVIVAIRSADRDRVGPVPDEVRVVESMPLDLFLPTCQAVVHQSGAGTTLAAAFAGVPQVTIPQVADQHLVSERLAETGAGVGLDSAAADVEGIRAATSRILFEAGLRTAARRLQDEMLAQPAPAEIVPMLEELV
jgi:UDP:flavonoid glycosyltransferase YjiC (YdhE family)